jgi:hypothetical protein
MRWKKAGRPRSLIGITLVSWNQKFFDPIELPSGRKLVMLRDAALYITKLPKAKHDAEEWQPAMQALMLVAEHDGPAMFARWHDASAAQA